MRKTGTRTAGPDVGVEIERDAQLGRHVDAAFATARIFRMRDRGENDPVRRASGIEHRVRQGGAAGLQGGETDLVRFEGETQRQLAIDESEHFEGGGRDLRTDAVARQHQNSHGFDPRPAPLRPSLIYRYIAHR